ncbi:type II CAAX endopeptidase family protein [Xanthomonas sp. LF06-19]|uniref:CPBP family intramembrane glutamic endopeptidase n=1 Tax=Xanthomonas sp. LF06-19 TaxID=3097551 RepID=UPI002A8165E1|nr:type II CAAX endopeptidase family protein [Xanthomonas sp. LF06-19]MDY4283050.1 type II CAAX endopeptidase family protein [Xanthomonas sp. LF06-19]
MTAPPLPATPLPLPSAPPARPRRPILGFFLDVLLAAVVLLAVSVLSGLVWGVIRGFQLAMELKAQGVPADRLAALVAQQVGQPGALAQLLIALVSTLSAALLLYFLRRPASAAERRASWLAARAPATWGWVLLVAVGVFVGSATISALAAQIGIKPVPTNLPLMQDAMAQMPLFLCVFAIVIAPAYEELLFRRVLFGRLWDAGRPRLGMLLSGAAFALVHEVPGTTGNSLAATAQLWLVYGGMGVAFAWLYKRTGTLWASIAAHGLNNAIAVAGLYWFGAT